MHKFFFDITFKKNTVCLSSEQFIKNYFKHSYSYLPYFANDYRLYSFNNTTFNNTVTFETIEWHFSDLNALVNQVKLVRLINSKAEAVVFLHGFVSPLHVLFLKTFLHKKVKIIVQHHAEKPLKHIVKRWLQKLAYGQASAYLFASKALANTYCDLNIIKDKTKIHEVMEGSSLFKKQAKQAARAHLAINAADVFLWVGRLDANKDPLTVLRAFNMYKQSGAVFKLFMIYSTSELEQQAAAFIKEHALTEDIILKGAVDHALLETWYSAADYFVAASHYEGSGIALCEAMSCGCIPLVTNIPSFSTMTHNGACGSLFEPGNANALFEKLTQLNAEAKEEWSRDVVAQFNKDLSFAAISKKIETIINSFSTVK